jgi:hypothetical protein
MLMPVAGFVVLVGMMTVASAADVKILKPENDKLIMTPSTDVEGSGSPEGANVTVSANGATLKTVVSAGKWSAKGVSLNVGANLIDVQINDKRASVLAVRGADDIKKRAPQKVRFLWNPGSDDQIKLIAERSLDATLTPDQLTAFAESVMSRTVEVFKARYAGVADVQVVSSDGDDVHTISMLRVDDSLFGQSPFDCGNTTARQVSRVHVGTYRSQLTQPTGPDGFISGWGPMRRTDAAEVRIEDVAQALGRTSAHEFGHSLGFTGETANFACRWMDGCDGGHNCDAFDARFSMANRFDSGWHVMDPGPKTLNNARLGEPDATRRSTPRKAPVFEIFGVSYLRIIHPPGP